MSGLNRPPSRVLALDQATVTGYAVGDNHSFENKTVEFGRFKAPKRQVLGERLLIFYGTLNELIDFYKPDILVYEKVFVPRPEPVRFDDAGKYVQPRKPKIPYNPDVTEFLLKLAGIVGLVAAKRLLPVEEYGPSSWRKTALGHGHPDEPKKAMRLRAKQLGYNVEVDDESDAIGILMHALHGPPANARAQTDLLDLVEPL